MNAARPAIDARIRRAQVSTAPLLLADFEQAVHHPAAGAVVSFTGVIRDHDHGDPVAAIEYEAHPDSEMHLHDLLTSWLARFPQVHSVAVGHRIGLLTVGNVAFVASVSSAHRAVAFGACSNLVDTVKEQLPIWKRQEFTDGTDEWVNAP